MQAGEPASAATHERQRRRAALAWLPLAILGVGLALWAKWGLAVAFEAVRAYCF